MSKIEWTDLTQNPIKEKAGGNHCVPISTGCKFCFASLLNSRGTRFGGNGRKFGVRPEGHPEMTLNVEMIQSWARMRKSKRIFVGSMTDIFGDWVPDHMIIALFDAMARATKQTFQILTKRPERMSEIVAEFLEWFGWSRMPENIWLGISAENQSVANDRYRWLVHTSATVRFLSLEPLLGPIDLGHPDGIDWIIIGGESGPNARPLRVEWVEDILRQCRDANISAFVKQFGSHRAKADDLAHNKGGNPDEWPPALRVRMSPGETWEKSGQEKALQVIQRTMRRRPDLF